MNLRRTLTLFSLLAASAAARAAEIPPAPPQQQAKPVTPPPAGGSTTGTGGAGGATPTAASMIIEEESTAAQAAPPPPAGDEKRAIGDYMRDNSGAIHDCYAKRLEVRPTLQGKLIARFDIGPNGKVIGASADGIADRDLLMCVVAVVRKFEFQKPSSGGKLRVAYPFRFEPQASR